MTVEIRILTKDEMGKLPYSALTKINRDGWNIRISKVGTGLFIRNSR